MQRKAELCNAHFQFHTEFKVAYEGKLNGETALATQYQQYTACYNDEDTALKKIRKSHLTEIIQNIAG